METNVSIYRVCNLLFRTLLTALTRFSGTPLILNQRLLIFSSLTDKMIPITVNKKWANPSIAHYSNPDIDFLRVLCSSGVLKRYIIILKKYYSLNKKV